MNDDSSIFRQGLVLIFDCWPVLKLAKEYQTGGPQTNDKIESLVHQVTTYFSRYKEGTTCDDLIDHLYNFCDAQLAINIEDKSVESTCEILVNYYKDSLSRGFSVAFNSLKGNLKVSSTHDINFDCNLSSEDDGSDIEENGNKYKPRQKYVEDDEGWIGPA